MLPTNHTTLHIQLGAKLFGIAKFAGLEYAELENDGRNCRGGICRTGK